MVKVTREKKFYDHIRALERKDFPEFIKDNIYAPDNCSYLYFAPSWHFGNKLLTEDIVDDLIDGKTILSVGSGSSYLERFLTDNLDVKKEQITLADKDPMRAVGFEKFYFDMYEEWPRFGKQFDYIIFPESVLINSRYAHDFQRKEALHNIIENSLATMNPIGQIRINGHSQLEENAYFVKKLVEIDHKNTSFYYSKNLITVERK